MEWYPTPSYLVKRQVILECLLQLNFTNVLEVGCGCGDLLHVLEKLGYSGLGIDISNDALAVAEAGLLTNRFKVVKCSPEELSEKFDVVIASEVLEHHQDDIGFLGLLRERLVDKGSLILTVPAHMKDWGPNDDFCGHVRRYGRSELHGKLTAAGYSEIVIHSYGVPIYNIMKPMYDRAIYSKTPTEGQMEKTADSGGMFLVRGQKRLFRYMFNDMTMFPFYLLQRLFYSTDIGKGYFAIAKRLES
jgi:SAM-dependent methyltransferase